MFAINVFVLYNVYNRILIIFYKKLNFYEFFIYFQKYKMSFPKIIKKCNLHFLKIIKLFKKMNFFVNFTKKNIPQNDYFLFF